MSDLKNTTGKFLGKQLVDEAPTYKRYKSQFEVEGKTWNFSFFMPWTKKDGSDKKGENPSTMVEGQMYRIGYTEYLAPGRDHPSKTAVSFFTTDAKPSRKLDEFVEDKQPMKNIVDVPSETVQKLIDTYFKLMKAEDINPNHFIGSIVRSLHEVQLQPLVDEYNKIRGIKEEKKE